MPDYATPLLIIVTGAPGAGKTTVARRLAADLSLPLVSKDDIKELLFESLGWTDREWSRRLGAATYPLLYYTVEKLLQGGSSAVVESNFRPDVATPTFRALRARVPFRVFQVCCTAPVDTVVQRYRDRAGAGGRHPGHADHTDEREMQAILGELRSLVAAGTYRPLQLPGELLELNTDGPASIPYADLLARIRVVLR